MTYALKIIPPAIKGLARLPTSIQQQIDKRIAGLITNPRPPGCIKLSGYADAYRIRAGDYRIVYLIDDEQKKVAVRFIAHRRDIYRNL